MINIFIVFGTRPEFIKLVEVIKALNKNPKIQIFIISSNQQRVLLKKYIKANLVNYELGLETFRDDSNFISKFLIKFETICKKKIINYLFVQGDTNTAYATSLYGFLKKIPIIHLEAGLRTYDLYNPYPEEFIRQSISKIAKIHLSQNKTSAKNLKMEGITKNIHIVGNPGIDHLLKNIKKIDLNKNKLIKNRILVTMHRRESLDKNLELFIKNLKKFLNNNSKFSVVWPLHSNPNILKKIKISFKAFNTNKILFTEPQKYSSFLKLLLKSEFVITDSGGVQEEAAYLGKKLLIARDKTERVDIVNLKLGYIVKADGSMLEKNINFLEKQKIPSLLTKKWRQNQGLGMASKKVKKVLEKIFT